MMIFLGLKKKIKSSFTLNTKKCSIKEQNVKSLFKKEMAYSLEMKKKFGLLKENEMMFLLRKLYLAGKLNHSRMFLYGEALHLLISKQKLKILKLCCVPWEMLIFVH